MATSTQGNAKTEAGELFKLLVVDVGWSSEVVEVGRQASKQGLLRKQDGRRGL